MVRFLPLFFPECYCSCIYCKHATDYFLFFGGCLDWPQEETEVPGEGGNTHLWEESWDDDDTSEDFSKQLKWVWSGIFLRIEDYVPTIVADRSSKK